jgi:hypothetical protein
MASSSSTLTMSPRAKHCCKAQKGQLLLWNVQVLPILIGAQLQGYLDCTTVTPNKIISVRQNDKMIDDVN